MGDLIEKLPMDKNTNYTKEEDELSLALFGEEEKKSRDYKGLIIVTLLFSLLSSPFLNNLTSKVIKNVEYRWIVHSILFFMIFFYIQKPE